MIIYSEHKSIIYEVFNLTKKIFCHLYNLVKLHGLEYFNNFYLQSINLYTRQQTTR